jgi:predicted dinucleotide-binding enzyme
MRIGVIGAGLQGGLLAKKLARSGHEVRVANRRGPESLKAFAQQTGTIASTLEDAATKSELIIVALPFKNNANLPKPLFKDLPDSTTIVDVSNYSPSWRDGHIPEVEAGLSETEWVEKQIGRPVVKAFNSIDFDSLEHLGKPAGSSDRIALSLAGDRVEDKKKVAKIIDDLGFDALDIGPLSESWRQQPGTPAYCTNLDLERLSAAVKAADRRAAPQKREEQSRAMVDLGSNATPLEKVKAYRNASL